MKKLLLLLTVIAVVFVVYNRQRLFLRDPLAKMYVDGAQVSGAQIFINYSNDVLILQDKAQPLILQSWDRTPGTPPLLPCLHSLACLMDNDHATKTPLAVSPAQTTMTNKEVDYRDESGKQVRITLR